MMWKTARLGDLCTKVGSGATPRGGKESYKDSGITLIRSQNVYNNRFVKEGLAFIDDEQATGLANVEIEPDDVLLNITGDSVARVCQVPSEVLPARVNQHVAIVRPDPGRLNPGYLRYWLVSPRTQAIMLSLASAGATRKALTKGMIEGFEIPLPKIETQRRIAHILGTLDDKIELNRRMNRTLETIARTIFKSWFVDFLPVRAKIAARTQTGDPVHVKAEGHEPVGMDPETAALFPDSFQGSPLGKIPTGWEVETLGDLCEKPQYGYTQSAKEEPVGPHFLRIKDINKQPWIEWESVPYCEIDDVTYEKHRLGLGDIVIARIADPGHAAYIEQDANAVFASYLIRFRLLDHRYGRYIQYWQKSEQYWDLVYARRSGSTRGNLNAKALSGFPVLVPPPLLTELFSQAVSPLRRRLVANTAGAACLARVRDELLPRLLTGELLTERSEVEDRE